tara:strand:+ start:302 stop:529 length:228 start_codon:yes stop_codon:yes gene_type:complete
MKTRILSRVGEHTNVVEFDLEATCKVPEFETYFRMRESNPKIAPTKWHDRFGEDMCLHFELAYSSLKEMEYENYD